MVPGVEGVATLSEILLVELFPHAELARTVMFPPQKAEPINT
jgi:hypothetical protein